MDTGSSQSFVLGSVLPFFDVFSDYVKVAVLFMVPVNRVSFIFGTDIADNKLFTLPEVVSEPIMGNSDLDLQLSSVFPACVLTHALQKTLGDVVDLSEFFLYWDEPLLCNTPESNSNLDVVPSVTLVLALSQNMSCLYCIPSLQQLRRQTTL